MLLQKGELEVDERLYVNVALSVKLNVTQTFLDVFDRELRHIGAKELRHIMKKMADKAAEKEARRAERQRRREEEKADLGKKD